MKLNKQSGQALVGTAIAMVVLAGFAGLAIDMGTLRYQKRLQQTAADAAAIAGAQNLEFQVISGGSGMAAGAEYAATQNGFTDSGGAALSNCDGSAAIGTICVQVNNPPADVSFGGGNSKPVVARAVATNVIGGTNYSCLYTLGPPSSAITGIAVSGKAELIAPNCGISDNGNLDTTGNAYTVEANTISVTGDCLGSHCGSPDVVCTASGGTCPPIGHSPSSQDPMKGLPAPAMPAYSSSCPAVPPAGYCDYVSPANSNVTIQPGTYNSITIGNNSTVTMAWGIYYFNGPLAGDKAPNPAGLNFNGGGTLTDLANPGVMLYFTNGSTMNKYVGGGNLPDVQLLPMTTAENSTYAGILIFQDPLDTVQAYVGGDNTTTYDGTIYMPTATLNFFGNSTVTFNGTVIAYSIGIIGSPIVTFGQSPAGVPIPALLTQPILVE